MFAMDIHWALNKSVYFYSHDCCESCDSSFIEAFGMLGVEGKLELNVIQRPWQESSQGLTAPEERFLLFTWYSSSIFIQLYLGCKSYWWTFGHDTSLDHCWTERTKKVCKEYTTWSCLTHRPNDGLRNHYEMQHEA